MKRKISEPNDLRTIPGVGPSISRDLVDLGFRSVANLHGADPEEMYGRLQILRGGPIDRCVLYVFRSAVYFAVSRRPDPELLKWWNWKDRPDPRNPKRRER
ncbi:MAG: helix-hairpin-helix domain-containing protein [Candidatus Eisenbacteria bacterium]|nr:helix-hairpin-helix domain-containing protein [Candidatus Eisenbacteria bacterium]